MAVSPIWLAFALASQPAAPPVTVEVVAVGHADTPATKFVLTIAVTATGDTEEKAKANAAKIKATLIDQLAAVGATLVPEVSDMSMAARLASFDVSTTTMTDDGKPAKPSASASLVVQAATRAAIVRAQGIVAKTQGASADQPPVSMIDDPAAATRAAKRDAIAKAKLDAQNYAEALGYDGASVVSVSERGDIGTVFTTVMSAEGRSRFGRGLPGMFGSSYGDTVPTDVTVTVTFRLDGKR